VELKNYQEDVVLGLIEILLEDEPEYEKDKHFKYDVAAYTLNRIPPKYFMSERGFTRFADLYLSDEDNPDSFVNLVELSVVINQAIETVKLRRSSNGSGNGVGRGAEPIEARYIHNFPHIIGKVLDKRTHMPVVDAKVTLFLDGEMADPVGPGWPNPYKTTQPGKGYFSFWPKCLSDSKEELDHSLRVVVEHDSYAPFEFDREFETKGGFERQEIIRNDSIVTLDTCLLEPAS